MARGDDLLALAEHRLSAWLQERTGSDLDADAFATAAVLIVVDAVNGQHVCVFSAHGWTLEHDLRCTLGRREDCIVEVPLRSWLQSAGRPRSAGRPINGGAERKELELAE